MFVGFYVSVVALVIAQVLPVASLLVVLSFPVHAPDVDGVLRAEAGGVAGANPVWPLWFAAMSFLVTRRAGGLLVLGLDRRRDRRLVRADAPCGSTRLTSDEQLRSTGRRHDSRARCRTSR